MDSLLFLVLAVVPIIVFAVLDSVTNLKRAVWGAMIAALLTFAANLAIADQWDYTLLIEPILILLIGFITLKFSNDKIFKFQPAVVDIAFAILLIYYQVFDTPFLLKYFPLMKKTMSPEAAAIWENPMFETLLTKLSNQLIYVLFLHAFLIALVAFRKSMLLWVLVRLLIYPMIFALVFVNFALLKL